MPLAPRVIADLFVCLTAIYTATGALYEQVMVLQQPFLLVVEHRDKAYVVETFQENGVLNAISVQRCLGVWSHHA